MIHEHDVDVLVDLSFHVRSAPHGSPLAWLVANKKMSAEAAAGASEADIARAWRRPQVRVELRRNRVELLG